MEASSGGLVTAMTPLLQKGVGGKWIGWAGTAQKQGIERALRASAGAFDVGLVMLTREEESLYYRGYSNEVLAPVLVGEVEQLELSRAIECWPIYQRVQRKFAEKIREDLRHDDIVWVHDYHLMGVGRALREQGVTQPVGFFLHTPFPSKTLFFRVPQRRALLSDLLAFDIIGFQTKRFESDFIDTVRSYLPEARISMAIDRKACINYAGHTTRLGSFPISIDTCEFERQLYAPETQRNIQILRAALGGRQLIFNAGRQDYAKGFLEEIHALDLMLERHPEHLSMVTLLQLVFPSRGDIDAYRAYKEAIIEAAAALNRKYGRRIVRQMHTNVSKGRYLAMLHVAAVQSVLTKADGMNLVAKESAIVGNAETVLLLGKNAGAAEELGTHAVLIDPRHIGSFAESIHAALTMSLAERRRRKRMLKSIVTGNDVFGWWSNEQQALFQCVWDERVA